MTRHLWHLAFLIAIAVSACAQSNAYPSAASAKQSQDSTTQTIYLPPGLDIQVRVNESLTSATAQAGDTFTGTLINSIEDDNGNIIFERGTQVTGRVISAKPSGRLQDSGQLVLSLNNIRSDKQVANVTVISKEVNGASHAGSNATKVGGGALLGAIIGGLAGGGKGAAIGAGVGAGAGAGAAAATGRKEARIDPESTLRFVTSTETTVVPAGSPAAQAMENQPSVYHGIYGPSDPNAPVLRRRNGSDVSDENSPKSTQTSTTIRSNPSTDSDAPVLRRREESSDSDTPAQRTTEARTSTNTASNPIPGTSEAASTSSTGAQFGFSARDRRLITNCLSENPGSVSAAASAIPYYKGDTLPYSAQRSIRSLPIACERQLEPISSDLERIIYNQQVLLINSNNLVLDSIDVPSSSAAKICFMRRPRQPQPLLQSARPPCSLTSWQNN